MERSGKESNGLCFFPASELVSSGSVFLEFLEALIPHLWLDVELNVFLFRLGYFFSAVFFKEKNKIVEGRLIVYSLSRGEQMFPRCVTSLLVFVQIYTQNVIFPEQ